MRIQHNLAALNAYRQLGNNNSALSKNLEKLSSGYRINRAGDDAAGLAISEKMRAQIKGLEAAQKNANDGISLVQTAEGALTEVHSMLNRMTYLATQSANGTYDDEVDRANLQAEVDSLLEEIDRISQSTNFNGLNLLDGSMDSNGGVTTGGEKSDIPIIKAVATDPTTEVGSKTVLHGNETEVQKTSFEAYLHDTVINAQDGDTLTVTIGEEELTLTFAAAGEDLDNGVLATGELDADTLATKIAAVLNAKGVDGGNAKEIQGQEFTIAADGGTITFEQTNDPTTSDEIVKADLEFKLEFTPAAGAGGTGTFTGGGATAGTAVTNAVGDLSNGGTAIGTTIEAAIKGVTSLKVGDLDVDLSGLAITDTTTATDAMKAIEDAIKAAATQHKTDSEKGTANYTDYSNIVVSADGTTGFSVAFDQEQMTYQAPAGGAAGGADSTHTGTINVGTGKNVQGTLAAPGQLASTTFDLTTDHVKDGATITIGDNTYTFKVGANSTVADDAENVIDLSEFEDGATGLLDAAKEKLSQQDNDIFTIGYDKATGKMSIHEKVGNDKRLDELKDQAKFDAMVYANKATTTKAGKALVLQVGDTADDFQKVSLDIKDMSTKGLGIEGLSISNQTDAADAIKKIKDAINTVSSQRGDLGAIQNRLEHTINNLGVQTENITAAESRIRDTDMAEEMMAYTKNNILVQAAQAMLAQANQVPQGILQLLQ